MPMTRELTEEEKIEYDRLTENAVQLEFDFEEMRKKPAINGEIWISCIEEVSDGISREDQFPGKYESEGQGRMNDPLFEEAIWPFILTGYATT